jgi:hypothetical protein
MLRKLSSLCSVAATLVIAVTIGFPLSPERPPSAGASVEILGAYGGGRFMAADPNGGYWTTSYPGTVTSYGGAPSYGSPAVYGIHLNQPILGMAATSTGHGYWLVASDGGIFSFGDAHFYGSTGAIHLNKPVIGVTATPTGRGYWLVASDGGIFSYGDARFFGSTGGLRLNQPIVGMAATPDGGGYWLVASDGGIFSFGDAQFYGSTGSLTLNQPIVGMATTPDGGGYWLVASDGGIFSFGDAKFYGSLGGSGKTVFGLVINPSASGYGLVATDGSETTFSASESAAAIPSNQPVTIGGGAQGADCQPIVQPTATSAPNLDSVIANQTGPGWIGGDGTYSTELPDGQESFVFSDTLVGTEQPGGSANLTGFTNNSELMGTLPSLSGDFGGTLGAPQSLIPDTSNSSDHWWTSATYIENGNQLVYVNEFSAMPGTSFGLFSGNSGIAVLSLSGDGVPTFSSITPLPTDADTTWGKAVVQDASYTYIYGLASNPSSGAFYGMKLARVPLGQSLNIGAWTYWNGSQWTPGEGTAALINTGAILTGVSAQAGGEGYVAVSIPGGLGSSRLALSYACSATGPWSAPVPVYTIPEVTQYQNEIAYIPTFHPELTGQGGLVVSYNTNNLSSAADLQNVQQYRPHFILLNG